ncbi:MAG: DHHA1 domain-containing protein, partial [Hydrogenobacter thermophilus]|nr:DHHA1 domain-containing protein [Hydrogenobacter thermophilus]
RRTGDIGYFKIVSESSVGAGVRRIVAKTGRWAVEDAFREHRMLQELSISLGVKQEDIPDAIQRLERQLKEKEKEVARLKELLLEQMVQKQVKEELINGIRLYWGFFEDIDTEDLRSTADRIRSSSENCVVFFITKKGERLSTLLALSKNLVPKLSAKEMIKEVGKVLGGGGGGREDLAQGGGTNLQAVGKAIERLKDLIYISRFTEV